jgi:hypothetical protein
MWHMDVVREKAISSLKTRISQHPSRRIDLARRFEITSWIRPALAQLASQDTPLDMEDVMLIGIDTVLKLCAVREHLLQQSQTCNRGHAISGTFGKTSKSKAMGLGFLEKFGFELADSRSEAPASSDDSETDSD